MGYNVQCFVDNIDPNLLCPVCQCVCQDTVLTPCGHTFCKECIETWLTTPAIRPCPQCRRMTSIQDIRPIWSMRNLISSLNITCSEPKCGQIFRLENLDKHSKICDFAKLECIGCKISVARKDLAKHQSTCNVIARSTSWDYDDELTSRNSTLELQVKRIREDLVTAEDRNRNLERELRKTRASLQERRQQLLEQAPDTELDVTAHTMAKLSAFISSYLLRKPSYVDKNRVFAAIKRGYLYYSDSTNDVTLNDLHMLLATANASDWFNRNQQLHFETWMRDLVRIRPRSV